MKPILQLFWDELFSTPEDPIDPAIAEEFQISTIARPLPPGLLDTMVAECLQAPAWVWKSAFEPLMTIDIARRLNTVTTPALILWGDQDTISAQADQALLLQALPQATRSTYQGHGHALHWEDPARVAADINTFVAGLLQ